MKVAFLHPDLGIGMLRSSDKKVQNSDSLWNKVAQNVW